MLRTLFIHSWKYNYISWRPLSKGWILKLIQCIFNSSTLRYDSLLLFLSFCIHYCSVNWIYSGRHIYNSVPFFLVHLLTCRLLFSHDTQNTRDKKCISSIALTWVQCIGSPIEHEIYTFRILYYSLLPIVVKFSISLWDCGWTRERERAIIPFVHCIHYMCNIAAQPKDYLTISIQIKHEIVFFNDCFRVSNKYKIYVWNIGIASKDNG